MKRPACQCGKATYFIPSAGISLTSRLAVTRLGLGTVSRLRVLAQHRSGVRFRTHDA
ncbi:hypothetical protein HYW60_01600 [Candidatus Kaiserbacteria bacterium]|nr:hypothetical protein [Candidatus Kaiserbacteria bacterium]